MNVRGSSTRTAEPRRNRELFFSLVGQHLGRLGQVVRRELAYHDAIGDPQPGELDPEDVVDGVRLRAYREVVRIPPGRSMQRWLMGRARDQLRSQVSRRKLWHGRTPIRTEDDVPETPPTEVASTLGDEALDSHEPDEDLKVEDIVPDLELPTPENEAARRELQWCVPASLAGMPQAWRRILARRYVDGLIGRARADAVELPETHVARVLEQATEYLRQRLLGAGCRWKVA
jgi:DNA-directed RNA polymerase specialized sigma24 family protein